MTKGMKVAVGSHLAGLLVALALAWFIPPLVFNFENVRVAQSICIALLIVWGVWKLIQILKRQDELGRKTTDHFNK